MDAIDVLVDGIGRSQEACHESLAGMDAAQVNWRPGGAHNSISWLVWHIAREQDVQIADLAGTPQVWEQWYPRFGLDLPEDAMGYGATSDEVAKVVVDDVELLTGYLDAAVAATVAYVRSLSAQDLDEVIDTRWDPPVTRGVRLVSVIDDAAQHAGQVGYVKGLLAAR